MTPDGRMAESGSENYRKVLLRTGGLRFAVPYDAVFTDAYLPP